MARVQIKQENDVLVCAVYQRKRGLQIEKEYQAWVGFFDDTVFMFFLWKLTKNLFYLTKA